MEFDGILMVYKFLLPFFVFFYHYFYIYFEYYFFFSECVCWAHIISLSSLLIHFCTFFSTLIDLCPCPQKYIFAKLSIVVVVLVFVLTYPSLYTSLLFYKTLNHRTKNNKVSEFKKKYKRTNKKIEIEKNQIEFCSSSK